MYTIEPHHDHKSLADADKFLFSLSRFMALFSLFLRFRAPEVKEEVRAQVDGSSRQWGGKEGGKEKETKNNRWWLFGGVRKENLLLLLRLLVKNLFFFLFVFFYSRLETNKPKWPTGIFFLLLLLRLLDCQQQPATRSRNEFFSSRLDSFLIWKKKRHTHTSLYPWSSSSTSSIKEIMQFRPVDSNIICNISRIKRLVFSSGGISGLTGTGIHLWNSSIASLIPQGNSKKSTSLKLFFFRLQLFVCPY